MEIKGITNGSFFVNKTKNTKTEANKPVPKDKIEISAEARDLAKLELSTERVEELRAKLAGGFYNSPEVLDKVAEKLSKDIIK